MGIWSKFQGRTGSSDSSNAPVEQTTASKGAEQQPNNPVYDSENSSRLSLEERNEKEIEHNPQHVTDDAYMGVQKAEAVALVWGKKAVIATYAW